MKTLKLLNYAADRWIEGGGLAEVQSAVTGETVALTGSEGLDFGGMLRHARTAGGPALRRMTFHERAWMLKDLANAVMARKEELYELSYDTGATRTDGWIDIEGGAGTLFSFSSKGRRELPNGRILIDGAMETLSKGGTFVGQHVFTPLQGVAVHINAFNFPVWGMLEKLAPTLIAGVPAIVKPATSTAYLTELVVRRIVESGILPPGSLQLLCGSAGDLFEHLDCQDAVAFTGSASTASSLRRHPNVIARSVRFTAETDSLNSSMLGPDAVAGTPEFDLFVREVAREMTVKAGQKCTAIRKAIVPAASAEAVLDALRATLGKVVVGDPRLEQVRMGPVASLAQRREVRDQLAKLEREAEVVQGGRAAAGASAPGAELVGADGEKGAFISPTLL